MNTITIKELNGQMAAVCENIFNTLSHRNNESKEGYKNYLYTELVAGPKASYTNDVATLYQNMIIARNVLAKEIKSSPMFWNGFGLMALGLAADMYVELIEQDAKDAAELVLSVLKTAGDRYFAHRTKFSKGKVKYAMPNFDTIVDVSKLLSPDERDSLTEIMELIIADTEGGNEDTTNNEIQGEVKMEKEVVKEQDNIDVEFDNIKSRVLHTEEEFEKFRRDINATCEKVDAFNERVVKATEEIENRRKAREEAQAAATPAPTATTNSATGGKVLKAAAWTLGIAAATAAGYWVGKKIVDRYWGE